MDNVTFRKPVEQVKQEPSQPVKPSEKVTTGKTDIEVPFTSYESESKVPYTAEYFGLKDIYHEPGALFNDEVEKIDSYFKDKVAKGQMVDKVEVIKDKIRKIEHEIGVENSERSIIRLAKVAAYIDFLKKTDNINLNNAKYG